MTSDSTSISAAFFDVDGTLVDATIAHYLRFFMLRYLPGWRRRLWDVSFLTRCAYYMVVDRIDRSKFNRLFYRNYSGLPTQAIRAMSGDCERSVCEPRLFAEAVDCIHDHRRDNHQIVFVTGSLDFIVRPLAERLCADHIETASLVERDGRFTGELACEVVGGHEKARRIREYARAANLDLKACHAYGDSSADLPMLEVVGFPHAVNPDRKLRREALARGWPIHSWTVSSARTQA